MPELAWAVSNAVSHLKRFGEDVDAGSWQGVPTLNKPDLITKEVLNLTFSAEIPATRVAVAHATGANLPWAEDHFQERVSHVPSNPGEQYKNWPWWQGQLLAFDSHGEFFSHTYQERFWPKYAGPEKMHGKDGDASVYYDHHPLFGIRYRYGDLDDVIQLLCRQPQTRQATFPIFFPEDTGAVHGGRVPCTLHYHFLLRNHKLHLWYPIRSCDAVRHFRDDVYMACRLCQWVIAELRDLTAPDEKSLAFWHDVQPGMLHFTAYSFHVHIGDILELV